MEFFWKKSNWEASDRHLLALQESPFKRKLPPVKIEPGVTLIRGPRQIGKSTWLKLLLKQQIVLGESVFFYTCEDLVDFQDLLALIQSQKNTQTFFLDEVTYVSEWWRAIKKVIDTRPHISIVLTGSNTFD